jgi:hypothetical protein
MAGGSLPQHDGVGHSTGVVSPMIAQGCEKSRRVDGPLRPRNAHTNPPGHRPIPRVAP